MSQVNIDDMTLNFDFAKSNAFAAEPVAMLDLVNVAIDGPMVKEGRNYLVAGENAQPRPKDSGVEIMRKRILLTDTILNFKIIIFTPDLL